MADHISTFRGNGSSSDPKPQSFFKACRAHIIGMVGVGEPEKMEWFELKLEAASEAEKWYEQLDSTHKKNMATLKAEFDKRFPADVVKELTAADKWDALKKFVLTEIIMMEIDLDGATGYSKWASQMLRMSAGIDDTNKVFVPMVMKDQIPSVLRKLLKTPASFAELAKQIQEVDRTLLGEKLEKKKGQREQEEYIAKKKYAETHPVYTNPIRQRVPQGTSNGGAAGTTTLGLSAAQAPPLHELLAQLNLSRQQPYAQQRAPQAPAAGPPAFPRRPAAGGNWNEPSAADLALRQRDPAVRMTDLTRTKLARAGNKHDYDIQVAAYEAAHGDLVPTEQRAYPLLPGTADIASRECIGCGYVHDGACTERRIPAKERTYRIAANAIHRIPRGPPRATTTSPTDVLLLSILQAYTTQRELIAADAEAEASGAYIEDVEQGNGDGTSS